MKSTAHRQCFPTCSPPPNPRENFAKFCVMGEHGVTSEGPGIVLPGCRFSSNKNMETLNFFTKYCFKQLGLPLMAQCISVEGWAWGAVVLFLNWNTPFVSEKAMAPHSSTFALKIPWTEEPGRLQSMGSLRVWHDWATSLSLFTFMHWRRKWQPTPVFSPGESQGWGSLVGCHLWGRTESDTTEAT